VEVEVVRVAAVETAATAIFLGVVVLAVVW